MNQAMKQRLIGLAVLLALGIIFLPALFNGGRPHPIDPMKATPPMPEVTPVPIAEPKPVAALANQPKKSAAELYELAPKSSGGDTHVLEKPAAQPSLNAHGQPNAWVLQIGVFSEFTKADALKKSLQAKGYKAFVRSMTRDNKTLNRVLVGPELDQKKLAATKAAIEKDFQISALAVKF